MSFASEYDALRALSARVGADPLLVQAAGGNTSIKGDGVMWIKASGTWLRDATAREIMVPVRIPEDAPVHYLNDREDAELLDWDAEIYRQALDKQAEKASP